MNAKENFSESKKGFPSWHIGGSTIRILAPWRFKKEKPMGRTVPTITMVLRQEIAIWSKK
jgi:hypothetical protein